MQVVVLLLCAVVQVRVEVLLGFDLVPDRLRVDLVAVLSAVAAA